MAWFQDGERGFAMSVRQIALPAGGGLGAAILLPTIAEQLGFRAVYATIAAFCLLTAVFARAWLLRPPRATPRPPSPPP